MTSNFDLTHDLDLGFSRLNICNLGMGGSTHMEWKGCGLDMILDAQWDWPWVHDHGAWQIDQPSNGSVWNSYSFEPVGQWLGYSFTDLGAEGCCRSLNALFFFIFFSKVRVGAKEGGSHYWEMAVAITCGYGGYLLPLLAAHSSFIESLYQYEPHIHIFYQTDKEFVLYRYAVVL